MKCGGVNIDKNSENINFATTFEIICYNVKILETAK